MTIIVGAGLAGLTCAKVLYEAGRPFMLLEAEATVGGRVRSARRDGYTLDRGFQVLFTRYPLVRRHLNLALLQPRFFDNGAIIFRAGRRTALSDPLRHPGRLLQSALSPAISPLDKMRLGLLAWAVNRRRLREVWAEPDMTALDFLRQRRFSARFINNLARPFFGGIFLDHDLRISARAFCFTYKMLLEGRTVLPAAGMGALSQQLADCLPREQVRLSTRVATLLREEGRVAGVRTEAGADLRAAQVVVATEAPAAVALTGLPTPEGRVSEVNVHFASATSLYSERLLLLNADGDAFINDAAQISNVAPEYAPPGGHLLSCTVVGEPPLSDDEIVARCRADLASWFGAEPVAALRPLSVQRIPYCQFAQPPGFNERTPGNATGAPGLLLAGDYTENSSIDGAMRSGEQAARLILSDA